MTTSTTEGPVIIAGARCTAVVAEDVPSVVDALRMASTSSEPLDVVVPALIAAVVRALPAFAVVLPERGQVRVLVRGALSVAATTADGRISTASADGVSTWTEQVIPDVAEVVVLGPHVRVHIPVAASFPEQAGGGESPTEVVEAVHAQADHQVPAGTGGGGGGPPALTDAEGPSGASSAADPEATVLPGTLAPSAHQSGGAESEDRPPPDDDEETRFRESSSPAGREVTGGVALPGGSTPDHPDSAPSPLSVDGREGFIDAVPRRASPQPAPVPSSTAAGGSGAEVEDGLTISVAELRAAVAAGGRGPTGDGPAVQAVACPEGHLNPPHADLCRICATRISDRHVQTVARPSLGRLRFDDGLVVELDRTVVLGRRPTPATPGTGAVTVPDDDRALSRNHAEVRVVDWQVFVVDCDSTNGTCVEIPGQPVAQLRPHDPYLITGGTAVSLGDVVRFVYDVSVS